MSLVFATTFFFFFFFFWGGGGVLRHSAVQTDFEFEISGPLVTPSTLWAPVTLVTIQTVSIQSADLGRLGLMLWSMGQIKLDIVLMSLVLHVEIVSHIVNLSLSVTLTQVSFLQLCFPSRSRGKKKSHKKRKLFSTSSSSSRRSSSPRE